MGTARGDGRVMRAPLHAAPETYSQLGDENSVDAEQRNQHVRHRPRGLLWTHLIRRRPLSAYAGTSAFLLEVLQ